MSDASILGLFALMSAGGLILLGVGWPGRGLPRRMVCVGVPLLPLVGYTVWMASAAPSPGGFFSPWTIGLLMLVVTHPWVLLWFVLCLVVWALGRAQRLKPDPSRGWRT